MVEEELGRMLGEKLAFPKQLSEKVHVETVGRWVSEPQLRGLPRNKKSGEGCAVVGFPPRTHFVTPVLLGARQ